MHHPDDLPPLDPEHGPSSFRIPRGVPVVARLGADDDEGGNRYQRRVEDIDPARLDPAAMIEHRDELKQRPSPFTVEGYIQGFADISEAAVNGHGLRRRRARFMVGLGLIGGVSIVTAPLTGLTQLF